MTHTAMVPLGDIADLQAGVGFPPDLQGRTSGDYPIAKVGDISRVGRTGEAVINTADHFVDDIDLVRLRARPIPAGSVLFAKIGEAIRQNHRVIAGRELLVDNNAMAAIPTERVESRYLFHFLRTVDFYALASATTVPALRKSDLQRLPVPLPPLPEQQRIAEILDKADALRATRRAALAQLDTLTQSIFLDMFGDPATNPKGWPVKRIEDITECLDRLRRPVTESDRNPGDVPYYGANGQQGWIDTALFDEPLVLVAEDGGYFDAPERGVAYRIDGPAWVNNHAHILRATLKRVDTEFLHRALRHFNFLPYISGTTRAKLTQGQLNAVKLFVPPLELQREFGKQVAGVERIGRATSLSGDQLDALFCSLQHRAFRGEL